MKKQEIIKELKEVSKQLNKSPGRREIPFKLYYHSLKQFNTFNKAKQEAGLSIVKRKCEPLSKKSLKLDKSLVRILAHLTFDGHLYKNLGGFHFASNNKKELEDLRKDVYKKFNIDIFKITKGSGYGKNNLRYWYFNRNLCKFLNSVGTPRGDKMVTKFDIPEWIKKNKKFAKEYLKMAYLCEGCKYKASKNTERIQINLNKSEEILKDGLKFMESLKDLLKQFNIETTQTNICKGNVRKKDGKITKLMRFEIRADNINKFINQIGWYK